MPGETKTPTTGSPNSTHALRWTLGGLTVGAIYLCWSLWPALVLAAWTAALARPWLIRFEQVLKGRSRAAAALSLLLFLVLSLPLGLLALAAVSGAHELASAIARSSSAESALEAIAVEGAQAPQLPTDLSSGIDLLRQYGAQGLNVLSNLAGAAATGLVAVFIYFAGAFAFLLEGPAVWRWCKRNSPLQTDHLDRFSAAFHETGRGLLVGVGLTTATQGLVATLVYVSLGVPRWWVLGPITGLASLLPLVGSALVWAPIVLGLFLTGHPIKGSILAVLGIGVISTVDNVLRPIFARMGALNIPMFLLFVSIFGGIAAVGAWGAILGPLVVRLWMEALVLQREAEGAPAPTA
jgi:predicted PurR-regulated permease PerM